MKQVILLFSFLTLLVGPALGQRAIEGRITDGYEPLIGVNIQVKEVPTLGAVTGVDGRYSLELPDVAKILVISYTGYTSLEIVIADQTSFDFVLQESATALDEIVVVGYGTQVRSKVTGTVSQIKSEEIENAPVTSLESAIQGRSAGVVITKQNGKLGQGINVRIRGSASINGNNEPLYILDGVVLTDARRTYTAFNVPVNPLADLNSNDIESISILKDAAATAIYGTRGSNGVVLITTKSGRANESRITLDINRGWSTPTKKRKWLNAAQYLELWDEAFNNVANENGLLFGLTGQQWKDFYIPGWDGGYDTDWESEVYNEDAGLTEVQLSASGGDEKTRYYISGGLLDQTGILIFNNFQRMNGRVNVDHQSAKKFKVGMRMNFNHTENNRVTTDIDFDNPIALIALPPVQPLYDPDKPDKYFENTLYFNPKILEGNSTFYTKVFTTLGNVYFDWNPIPQLTLHSDFGVDHRTQDDDFWFGSATARNTGEPGGVASSSFRTTTNFSTNHYLNYSGQSAGHGYNITAGMSFQESNQHYNRVQGRNFPNDDFQNVQSAADIFVGRELEFGFSNLSYFGRANYDYQGRYLLSFTGRIDGDSRFGPDNRYGFFPAASLGWVLSEEPFLATINPLSYLKLRASWGQTGNTPLNDFAFQSLFWGGKYAGLSGIRQFQLANPKLKWEKTAQVNIGLDIGILNDRISGSVDLYQKKTDDLLLQVNIPGSSGFESQLQNIGKLENIGIEFMINSYNITGAFKWKTNINLGANENKITDIQGQVIEGSWVNRAVEGEPIGVFFAPEFAGVDPDNGDALYYLNTELANGELDRNTTNNINLAERVVLGDPNPDFTFGINNTWSYKGISLELFFQGVSGNEIYNAGGIYQMDGFGWFDNQDVRMLDRWQNPGDQTDIPQLRFLEAGTNSSRFVEDGSFVRLKTLSLRYDLPKNWIARIGMEQLQIYCNAQNLWTITNYQGWDPEVNADFTAGNNVNLGIDFYSAPQAKTIVFGLKAGF